MVARSVVMVVGRARLVTTTWLWWVSCWEARAAVRVARRRRKIFVILGRWVVGDGRSGEDGREGRYQVGETSGSNELEEVIYMERELEM